jgi:hypothetical protein
MKPAKKSIRPSRYAFTALLLVLLPFVVGFDFPDTTGIHGRISAGRGTYSLSSCSRSFRSEYIEENVAVRATFATGSDEPDWANRLRPGRTTVGAYGNWTQEELLLLKEDGVTPTNATPKDDWGQSYGLYTQFDWRFFGLQAGAVYLSQWETDAGRHGNSLYQTAEVRLGPELLYASAALLSSTPILSGGGGLQGGIGGRVRNTRAWGGLSVFPARETSLTLKLSQKVGLATLSVAGQWGLETSNYGSREQGLSLGIDIPLSKAW